MVSRRRASWRAEGAVILGRWSPLQLRLQFANPNVPYQLLLMLPYLASILALLGLVGRPTPPAASGVPYRCEAA